jgi:ubiquinone/menaquinone biosynthesis C-methylase UbiE
MGFFTLPMARLVGAQGHVVAVDLQQKMLNSLERRLKRAKLINRVNLKLCPATSLGLDDYQGKIDFALTFAVLHEMPDILITFQQVARSLKPGGTLLVAEPTGHVSAPDFELTIAKAKQCGLTVIDTPSIKKSHTAVLRR